MTRVIVDCALYHHGVARGVAGGLLPTRWPTARAAGRRASSGSGCTSRPRTSSTRSPPSSRCTRWRSRTRSRRTSGPRSRSTTTRCSSSSRRCATTRTAQQIELGDVMLFVGDSFVVTVRHGEGRALARRAAAARARAGDPRLRPVRCPLRVADTIVDDYSDDRPRGRGGHRGGRAAGLLPRPPQQRGAGSTTSSARCIEFRRAVLPLVEPMAQLASGDGAARRTSTCSRSSATSPTTRSGSPSRSRASTTCSPRSSTPTWRRSGVQQNDGHAPDLGLGGDRGGPDDDRRDLRDELRAHARAALAVRLPGRPRC